MTAAEKLKANLPVAMTMEAFMGISWYIAVELNVRLFMIFNKLASARTWYTQTQSGIASRVKYLGSSNVYGVFSLFRKAHVLLVANSPLRANLAVLRNSPYPLITVSTLPSDKERATLSTANRILFSTSSTSSRSEALDQKQHQCRRKVKHTNSQGSTGINSNPEIPTFSFEGLGLSRNMKMVVLGLVGVFGTVETWFWCKAIWRWWTAPENVRDSE
ncbi:hypothetical protein I7I51_04645 [Histoplasma capsulatum]|uniref:Uncharacterized protein n=1 Tax=Ajellomyces capsulatus TaxID=5037 RepID=A0A8A1M1A5_AJECA|nr:hypothetical protein I7I51_04645 [Histoplasma capsulatum]